jgi:aerobic-type carbon monoxide dehydrogenase small subunit (CoxS/CutS family)
MSEPIVLLVNGQKKTITSEADRSLLDVLREDLDMTGTKYACGEGQCGACTVLVDGQPVRSCVTEVGKVADKEILTIEGLSEDGELHRLQEAFLEEGAVQCGYCTSGMILGAVALLEHNARPTEDEIVAWMNSHICRCNGYPKIVSSIQKVAQQAS